MFFPPFNKRSSRFADVLFLALVASQNVYHVVNAAVDVFWTSVCTAYRGEFYGSCCLQFLTLCICNWGSHICLEVVFCLFLFEWVSTGWHVQDCLADFGSCDKPTLVCRGIVLCRLANDAKYVRFLDYFHQVGVERVVSQDQWYPTAFITWGWCAVY